MDDMSLVKLLICNPEEGLHEIIKKYRGLVGSIIGRILVNSPMDIEECIADTFLSIWRNSKKIKPERGTLKGLIASTAKNIAIDRYRKITKDKHSLIKDFELHTDGDLLDIIEKKYDGKTAQSLILEMKEPDREIFVRRFFLLQTNKEIVECMDIDEKQVKNRIYQGRIRLKNSLRERRIER